MKKIDVIAVHLLSACQVRVSFRKTWPPLPFLIPPLSPTNARKNLTEKKFLYTRQLSVAQSQLNAGFPLPAQQYRA